MLNKRSAKIGMFFIIMVLIELLWYAVNSLLFRSFGGLNPVIYILMNFKIAFAVVYGLPFVFTYTFFVKQCGNADGRTTGGIFWRTLLWAAIFLLGAQIIVGIIFQLSTAMFYANNSALTVVAFSFLGYVIQTAAFFMLANIVLKNFKLKNLVNKKATLLFCIAVVVSVLCAGAETFFSLPAIQYMNGGLSSGASLIGLMDVISVNSAFTKMIPVIFRIVAGTLAFAAYVPIVSAFYDNLEI